MNKIINVGVVGSQLWEAPSTIMDNFMVKKIFLTEKIDHLKTVFPGAEIVNDMNAIVDDSSIELVIISPNHLHTVRQVIEAGKSVRVMNYVAV